MEEAAPDTEYEVEDGGRPARDAAQVDGEADDEVHHDQHSHARAPSRTFVRAGVLSVAAFVTVAAVQEMLTVRIDRAVLRVVMGASAVVAFDP